MKKISRNWLALSSFGFSMIQFCIALRFDAWDICFHKSGHTLSGLEVVCFLVSLPPDHVFPSGGLSFNEIILWSPSMHLIILFLHPRSSNHQYFLHHYIKWCMCISGKVDVLQWNRKWFFSRHVQFDSGFHVMATNEISRNRPEIMSGFRISQRWVILKRVWRRESVWFSSKKFMFLSSIWTNLDWGGCSQPEIFTVPSATGNLKLSPCFHRRWHFLCIEPSGVDFRRVHLLQFLNVCDHNVSFPDSSRIQYITEEFSWQDFWTKLMWSRYVFRRNRMMFDHCTKRSYWSSKWHSEPPFIWSFPSSFVLDEIWDGGDVAHVVVTSIQHYQC